jgi:hypothetical protein
MKLVYFRVGCVWVEKFLDFNLLSPHRNWAMETELYDKIWLLPDLFPFFYDLRPYLVHPKQRRIGSLETRNPYCNETPG